MDDTTETCVLPEGAWTPKVGEVVRFISYHDKVVGQFQPGQLLVVTLVYEPDSEWFGGVQAVSNSGVKDFVWTWELMRVMTPEYLNELVWGKS